MANTHTPQQTEARRFSNQIPLEPEYQRMMDELAETKGVSKVELIRQLLRREKNEPAQYDLIGMINVPGGLGVPIYTMTTTKKAGKR